MGAVIGACTGYTKLARHWPTAEMSIRGEWENFFVGIPVAFFSGLGVAVSLLDEQSSSLVGVAISASLLPPAVNSGVLWVAFSFTQGGELGGDGYIDGLDDYLALSRTNETFDFSDEEGPQDDRNSQQVGIAIAEFVRNYLAQVRASHGELNEMGAVSLSLTLVNIVLIWFSSMLMFRIKEVLPIHKKIFWEDLGVARKIYRRKAFIVEEEIESEES